jgi:hypothetical protein
MGHSIYYQIRIPFWEFLKNNIPDNFLCLGGSIFQAIALNYQTAPILHQDQMVLYQLGFIILAL